MPANVFWLPILALILPTVLVPVLMGIRLARIEREFEHAERMKALELGRTLPQDQSSWGPAKVALVLGAGVPLGGFTLAWLASDSVTHAMVAWSAAGVVGLAGLASGTWLAQRHFFGAPADRYAKAPIEDDAFDVVGARG